MPGPRPGMTGFDVILLGLPAAKGAAEEIAEFGTWPAPRRWRLAIWVTLLGVARIIRTLIAAISRAPARPTCPIRAGAFGDGRGFDPAGRAAIGVLNLHPARLARDHPDLPARGKRIYQRRLHRRLGTHVSGAGDHMGPFLLLVLSLACARTEGILLLDAVRCQRGVRRGRVRLDLPV